MRTHIKPPVFVPPGYIGEIKTLSKAALMDLVWSFAMRCSNSCDDPTAVMATLREERDNVRRYRASQAGRMAIHR